MNQEKLEWELPSGTWLQNEKNGYKLHRRPNVKVPSHMHSGLLKQLLNLPSFEGQIFPPEFKYHPSTGNALIPSNQQSDHYWLGAYGNSIDLSNQPKPARQNGLQLNENLRLLKQFPEDVSAAAPQHIGFDLPGSYEFLSICIGTPYQQLIALNKIDGALYLLNEELNTWQPLEAIGLLLAPCPQPLLQSWQVVSFLNTEKNQHQLYIPTTRGLACLTIQGLELTYKVDYHSQHGVCLSSPTYWNKRLIVPMFVNQQVKIVDILSQQVIETSMLGHLGEALYFERVVYDPQYLIWVGSTGQLVLHIDAEHNLTCCYEQWLPNIKPDFRFGAPYLDRMGKFYQLCQKADEGWIYLELNAPITAMQMKSSFRFTTGRVKYSFQDIIKEEIWTESGNSAQDQKIVVPFIEDPNHQYVLGFRFEENSSQSIDYKLSTESAQDIILFLDTPNHPGLIHRISVKKPLDSRFFYHRDHLYFYNPNLTELSGWEVQS
ncbi:hypothetical protein [Acinetobacter sp. ANC 5378]|uniref:hypothetical protein n=1 Tax=Acinetobacter sp. ANC 5378 TaxID=2731249 RepID=UPI00148FC9F6|nr:hypothetical protein [Acinetobacter sp. ANC 5378]NNG81405.1 hypothetical protein [Acinetobacter sp. ANC 5378]